VETGLHTRSPGGRPEEMPHPLPDRA